MSKQEQQTIYGYIIGKPELKGIHKEDQYVTFLLSCDILNLLDGPSHDDIQEVRINQSTPNNWHLAYYTEAGCAGDYVHIVGYYERDEKIGSDVFILEELYILEKKFKKVVEQDVIKIKKERDEMWKSLNYNRI
jgi:hypothetical protein